MNRDKKKPTLRIYVGQHCWSCDETLRLADEVRKSFPSLTVELIDLDTEENRNVDDVFSVPTYVFEECTISLGNPSREELFSKVSASLVCSGVDI